MLLESDFNFNFSKNYSFDYLTEMIFQNETSEEEIKILMRFLENLNKVLYNKMKNYLDLKLELQQASK